MEQIFGLKMLLKKKKRAEFLVYAILDGNAVIKQNIPTFMFRICAWWDPSKQMGRTLYLVFIAKILLAF